jgi:hypothetical protein
MALLGLTQIFERRIGLLLQGSEIDIGSRHALFRLRGMPGPFRQRGQSGATGNECKHNKMWFHRQALAMV